MRRTTGLLASLCVLGTFQSLPAFVQAQESKAEVQSSTISASSSSATELTAEEKAWVKQGYKLKVSKGSKVFCRMETQIGSHFEHSACYTTAELESRTNSAKETFEASRRTSMGGVH